MTQLKLLSPEIAQQSISRREIVLPLNAAIEAVDYCAINHIHMLWGGRDGSRPRMGGSVTAAHRRVLSVFRVSR